MNDAYLINTESKSGCTKNRNNWNLISPIKNTDRSLTANLKKVQRSSMTHCKPSFVGSFSRKSMLIRDSIHSKNKAKRLTFEPKKTKSPNPDKRMTIAIKKSSLSLRHIEKFYNERFKAGSYKKFINFHQISKKKSLRSERVTINKQRTFASLESIQDLNSQPISRKVSCGIQYPKIVQIKLMSDHDPSKMVAKSTNKCQAPHLSLTRKPIFQ